MGKEYKIGVISPDPNKDRAVKLKGSNMDTSKWKSYASILKRNQTEQKQQTKKTTKAIRSIIDANTKSKLRQTIKRIPGVSALMEKRSPPYAKMSWPSLSSLSQKSKRKNTPGRRRLRKKKRKTVRYPNEKNSKNRRTPKTKGGSWIY
jgi:hypothetical protein